MNMKFKDKYNISKEFEDLFTFADEAEEIEHEAKMLMFKFLEQLEKLYPAGTKLKKKEIAKALGKSPSYITQLYRGDKIANLELLAKIQKEFDITFDITAHSNKDISQTPSKDTPLHRFSKEPRGYWVWVTKQPDYSKPDDCCNAYEDNNHEVTAA